MAILDLETEWILRKKVLQYQPFFPKKFTHKKLNIILAGIELENPLILGAGFDKTGQLVKPLFNLGFAAVEVGSIAENPQPGNPKPRFFKIADGVLLNRFGFNSPGVKEVAKNLEQFSKIPVGINLGINKAFKAENASHHISQLIIQLHSYASYFVINVSSPNTPGLRQLQQKKYLNQILSLAKKNSQKIPLFVKIAPDLTLKQLDSIIEVALTNKIAGIIATNTTTNQKIKTGYSIKWAHQSGGISGNDPKFRGMSNKIISYIYKQSPKKLVIIGVGGINNTETALEKIMAGATAIQLVSALYGEVFSIADKINRGLVDWMNKNKVKNISELIGKKLFESPCDSNF